MGNIWNCFCIHTSSHILCTWCQISTCDLSSFWTCDVQPCLWILLNVRPVVKSWSRWMASEVWIVSLLSVLYFQSFQSLHSTMYFSPSWNYKYPLNCTSLLTVQSWWDCSVSVKYLLMVRTTCWGRHTGVLPQRQCLFFTCAWLCTCDSVISQTDYLLIIFFCQYCSFRTGMVLYTALPVLQVVQLSLLTESVSCCFHDQWFV